MTIKENNNKKIQWGIVGTGNIASQFAQAHKVLNKSKITGAFGTSFDKAKDFTRKIGMGKAYNTIEEMLDNKEIDCIYIATPNNSHYEYIIKSLEAGKNVLCEKPITINPEELKTAMEIARKKDVLFLESLWTVYLPAIKEVHNIIRNGEIGKVSMIQCDFSFKSEYNEKHRLFNKELGGGATLDVGIYTIVIANHLLGKLPTNILASAVKGPTGVDHRTSIIMNYDDMEQAVLVSGIDCETEKKLVVSGDKGRIIVDKFWSATGYKLEIYNEKEAYSNIEHASNGLEHIIDAFRRLVGKDSFEYYPIESSYETLKIMEEVLKQIGVSYNS
ncbi:MAG TPA: Gfo/Idh/MocA family oxidoreductase [Clostridiales bacterium]|nr:Gfo/Idh/MocA family oxidoreductase [Clostridiales bacterium]